MNKICTKCNLEKDVEEFSAQKRTKNGFQPVCKNCNKIYRQKNKKKISEYQSTYQAKYYTENKDHKRLYGQVNSTRINEKNKKRRITDPVFKLRKNLRTRLSNFVAGRVKNGVSAIKDLGCSLGTLKAHLEAQFKPGMTWQNYSPKGWHIDHIVPLASASNEEALKALCYYKNLQPLWAKENLVKSDKMPTESNLKPV